MLKRTAAFLMAAEWLLLSVLQCACEQPASSPAALKGGRATHLAQRDASRSWSVQFLRLRRASGAPWFAKCIDPGASVGGGLAREVAAAPAGLELAPAACPFSNAWQFELRAALEPRAPCLA